MMMTLTVRPYTGETDLQPIADLLNLCASVDRLDHHTSTADLRLDFNEPNRNPSRDLHIWEDGDGTLIGFGQIWIPKSGEELSGWLGFQVHPKARGRGLETEILTWGETRLQQVRSERGGSAKLWAGTRDDQSDRMTLLENAGFAVNRRFLTMIRSLIPLILTPQFPTGFTLTHTKGKLDAEAWVELFNQSFIDHWNHHPETVEEHCYWLDGPNYRPERDLVAIAPDGTFAAFCYCHIDPIDNSHRGCNEGWISVLGTRRGFRRRGLGRAMLLAGMQCLWEAGVDTAKLGVDTENPNCAMHLYESVGFRRLHTRLSYAKDV